MYEEQGVGRWRGAVAPPPVEGFVQAHTPRRGSEKKKSGRPAGRRTWIQQAVSARVFSQSEREGHPGAHAAPGHRRCGAPTNPAPRRGDVDGRPHRRFDFAAVARV